MALRFNSWFRADCPACCAGHAAAWLSSDPQERRAVVRAPSGTAEPPCRMNQIDHQIANRKRDLIEGVRKGCRSAR